MKLCGEPHPTALGTFCHRSDRHRSSHCAVVNGIHANWTEDVAVLQGAKAGADAGRTVGHFANFFTAYCHSLQKALVEAGFGPSEPESEQEAGTEHGHEMNVSKLILLDSNGNAWKAVAPNSWVRANALQRTDFTRTRASIDIMAGPTKLYQLIGEEA